MTLQEKLDYFWAVGEVPGSIFDDISDRHRQEAKQPRYRQGRGLHLIALKEIKEALGYRAEH